MLIKKIFDTAELTIKSSELVTEESILTLLSEHVANLEKENSENLDYNGIISSIKSFLVNNKEISVYSKKPGNDMNYKKLNLSLNERIRIPIKKEDEFEKQITTSIAQYEELLENQKRRGKEISATLKVIALMKTQLNVYKNKNSKTIAHTLKGSRDESYFESEKDKERQKALKEIFYHYCKQQIIFQKKTTFDQLNQVAIVMNIGEFMKFCVDFGIPLNHTTIKILFKKIARQGKELNYQLFCVFI